MRLALVAAILAAITALDPVAAAGSDWEYRARIDMSGPLAKDIDMKIMAEVRNRDDFRTHYESHFEAGLEWKLEKWLALGPYYRQVSYKKGDAWLIEHRPNVNVTLKWKLLGLGMSDRSRFEFRSKGSSHSSRYRNRLMLKFPDGAVPVIRPYISTEPFYDFKIGEINKNRLTAGFDVKAILGLTVDVSYILDSVKTGNRWDEINALGVSLKYGS